MTPPESPSPSARTRQLALLPATFPRRAALAGLVVAGGTAVVFTGWAALASLSFEPTDASQFKAWAFEPVGTAGGIALGCCVLGLISWFLARRFRRLLGLAGLAVVASGAVLVWGAVEHASRAHPEYDQARTLQRLEMPTEYIIGPTQLDHASDITAPAATRVWTTTAVPATQACSDLAIALAAWADGGSVRTFRLTTVQRCYISASKDGHSVDANVTTGIHQVIVSVRVAG